MKQLQQPALVKDAATRMPAPPTAPFLQPQQLALAGASGTGMPAPPAAPLLQPQQLASAGASSTGMPAPLAAPFLLPQQLALAGAPDTGMPGSSTSQPHHSLQRLSAGAIASVAPPAPIPPKPTSSTPSVIFPLPNGIDKKGRPIMHQGGRTTFNNFNNAGCSMSQCCFLYVCAFCGGGHTHPACPHNPTSQKLGNHLSTPINISTLAEALHNHPNPVFVMFLLSGIREGFHPGISAVPEAVDRLLAKEVKEGFMIGLFTLPSFPTFHISPLGITTRKYSRKKCIIVELSAPHSITIPSINNLILSKDFSLHYATINHAICLIKRAGKRQGAYYFAIRFAFGCKSSPKLFDTLFEVHCWILSNNHNTSFLIHLLDDFRIVSPPLIATCFLSGHSDLSFL
eukprot:superscaffoldBa00010675_g24833